VLSLIGAGPRVASPLDPLDARPGWGPREPQPGRVRASLFAGGGPPLREFRSLPRRFGPRCQRRGPRVSPAFHSLPRSPARKQRDGQFHASLRSNAMVRKPCTVGVPMPLPRPRRLCVTLLLIGGMFSLMAAAQSDRTEDVRRVQRATEVFRTIFTGPGDAIPRNLLRTGQCLVIIPGYKNLALGIGGAYGKGIATCRNNIGANPTPPPGAPLPSTPAKGTGWSAPIFVALGGASLGPQIGVESADVVMVFQSREGLESVLNNKVRLGV